MKDSKRDKLEGLLKFLGEPSGIVDSLMKTIPKEVTGMPFSRQVVYVYLRKKRKARAKEMISDLERYKREKNIDFLPITPRNLRLAVGELLKRKIIVKKANFLDTRGDYYVFVG